MNTETAAANPVADSERSDIEAVLKYAFEGAPLDPEVARRVDERAARITEHIRRSHGELMKRHRSRPMGRRVGALDRR